MSAFDAYEQHDLLGLADRVRNGETTPAELLEAALERIEARNPALNAFVHVMEDAARAAVAAGLPDGPLRGVPYALKDLYMLYAGEPTTNGSRVYADHVADHDSTLVARLRAAGLVIVGKTNTPELGLNASTEPVLHGPTRNPWAPDRKPGGSSGGAAAAVAAGILPAAHATDGGGSIRIPASDCGLFGLKPTRARNPQGPDVGEGWSGLATGHAVTRTVRDSAALLDATHGPAPGDPYAAPPPVRPFLEEVGADPPLLLGTLDMMEDDFEAFSNRLLDHIPFTPLFNISGCPAASLPLHWTADDLPVGVRIGTRFGGEATLLRLAASIEQARPWGRRPG